MDPAWVATAFPETQRLVAYVVPATTAFTYRGRGLTVPQIASDAAVRFVLGGSVMTSGQDVRVTAGSPRAYRDYYEERFLPEWKRAGLP